MFLQTSISMEFEMTDAIYLTKKDSIAEIVLNQPDKRNAINATMWSGLGDYVKKAINDPDIAMIVITGMGSHFAAGADITEFEEVYRTSENARTYTQTMLDSLKTLELASKPTLAKIDGVCVGGGCSIALACDLRLATQAARFCIPPSKLGIAYPLDDTRRLVRAIGRANAMTMLFTARIIDAKTAAEMGLVTQLAEDYAELETCITTLGEELASVSSWSLSATKKVFGFLDDGIADADPRAETLLEEAFTGPHFREGYRAFLEKRKPIFPKT